MATIDKKKSNFLILFFLLFFLVSVTLSTIVVSLFLTSNRVKVFDEAFLSRIDVTLHSHDLFLMNPKSKSGMLLFSRIRASALITPEQISTLAKRNINGRQIKNAARTAPQSLAAGKGEQVTFKYFNQALDVMEEFHAEFRTRDRE